MSEVIDNKIVSLEFQNENFEEGAEQSMETIAALKKAIASLAKLDSKTGNVAESIDEINKSLKKVDPSNLVDGLDLAKKSLSSFSVASRQIIKNITSDLYSLTTTKISSIWDTTVGTVVSGGKTRALNIEDAKFKLEGMGLAWSDISKDIEYGVNDTAYALDEAATIAAQLVASNVDVGTTIREITDATTGETTSLDEMAIALRGISGLSAMTSSSYSEIGHIFTTIAGNGRLMTEQLNQIGYRGINAAAGLKDFFNGVNDGSIEATAKVTEAIKSITGGAQISEAELRELVTDGVITFNVFAEAMDTSFGEHAKEANRTVKGVTANVQSALKKIGADFWTPIVENDGPLVQFLENIRQQINGIRVAIHEALGWDYETDENGEIIDDETSRLQKLNEVAQAVINGEYGNGMEEGAARYTALTEAGYDAWTVQDAVDKILRGEELTVEDLTDAFTGLTDAENQNAEASNNGQQYLTRWKELVEEVFAKLNELVSGIDQSKVANAVLNILETLLSVGRAVGSIITSIASLFSSVIGGFFEGLNEGMGTEFSVTETISKVASGIADFVESLKPSEETLEKIRSIASSVGSVVGNVVKIISPFVKVIWSIIKVPVSLIGKVAQDVLSVIEYLTSLGATVISKFVGSETFGKIQTKLKTISDWFGEVVSWFKLTWLKDDGSPVFYNDNLITNPFTELVEKIATKITEWTKGTPLQSVWESLQEFHPIQMIAEWFQETFLNDTSITNDDGSIDFSAIISKVWETISDFFSSVITKISEYLSSHNLGSLEEYKDDFLSTFQVSGSSAFDFLTTLFTNAGDVITWVSETLSPIIDDVTELITSVNIHDIIEKVKNALSQVWEFIKGIFSKDDGAVAAADETSGLGSGKGFDTELLEFLAKMASYTFVLHYLSKTLTSISDLLKGFSDGNKIHITMPAPVKWLAIAGVIALVAEAIESIVSAASGMKDVDYTSLGIIFGAMVAVIIILIYGVSKMSDSLTKLAKNKDFDGKKMQRIAKSMMTMSIALIAFAAAVKIMSSIDLDANAVGSIAITIGSFAGIMALMMILSKNFSSNDKVTDGLKTTESHTKQINSAGKRILAIAFGMLVIANAMSVFAGAVAILSMIDLSDGKWAQVALVFGAFTGIMYLLGTLTTNKNITGTDGSASDTVSSAGRILALAGGMILISTAFAKFATAIAGISMLSLDAGDIATIAIVIGAFIGIMALLGNLSKTVSYTGGTSTTNTSAGKIIAIAGSMVLISDALMVFCTAITAMALVPISWNTIGVLAMFSGLMVGLTLLSRMQNVSWKNMISLAGSMVLISAALVKFTAAIALMGVSLNSASIGGITIGLVAFAAAIGIIVGAMALLTKMNANWKMLLGLGVVISGIGIALQAVTGLITLFMVSGTGASDALITIITAIISTIPQLIASLAQAISDNALLIVETVVGIVIDIAQSLADNATELTAALAQTLISMFSTLGEYGPQIVDAIADFLISIADELAVRIPEIMGAGGGIYESILEGLGSLSGLSSIITLAGLLGKFVKPTQVLKGVASIAIIITVLSLLFVGLTALFAVIFADAGPLAALAVGKVISIMTTIMTGFGAVLTVMTPFLAVVMLMSKELEIGGKNSTIKSKTSLRSGLKNIAIIAVALIAITAVLGLITLALGALNKNGDMVATIKRGIPVIQAISDALSAFFSPQVIALLTVFTALGTLMNMFSAKSTALSVVGDTSNSGFNMMDSVKMGLQLMALVTIIGLIIMFLTAILGVLDEPLGLTANMNRGMAVLQTIGEAVATLFSGPMIALLAAITVLAGVMTVIPTFNSLSFMANAFAIEAVILSVIAVVYILTSILGSGTDEMNEAEIKRLRTGANKLAEIARAIGEFIGAFVGAIGHGFITSLLGADFDDDLGTTLSEFFAKVQPLLDYFCNPDISFNTAAMDSFSQMMLSLASSGVFAATQSAIDTVNSWFGGKTSNEIMTENMDTALENLDNIVTQMSAYTPEQVERLQIGVQCIQDIATAFNDMTHDTMWGSLAGALEDLAVMGVLTSLQDFMESLAVVTALATTYDDTEVEQIEWFVGVLKDVVSVGFSEADSLESALGAWVSSGALYQLAGTMGQIGLGLNDFVTAISTDENGKLIKIEERMGSVSVAMYALRNIVNALSNADITEFDANGKLSFASQLGEHMGSLGTGLKEFAGNVRGVTDDGSVTTAISVLNAFKGLNFNTTLADVIAYIAGYDKMDKFATNVKSVGQGVYDFYTATKDLPVTTEGSENGGVSLLNGLLTSLNQNGVFYTLSSLGANTGGFNTDKFATNLSNIGCGIKSFSAWTSSITQGADAPVLGLFTGLIDAITQGYDSELWLENSEFNGETFKNNVIDLAAGLWGFYAMTSTIEDGACKGATQLLTDIKDSTSGISGDWWQQLLDASDMATAAANLGDLGTAIKNFYDNATNFGTETSSFNTAILSLESLGEVDLSGLSGDILQNFGDGLATLDAQTLNQNVSAFVTMVNDAIVNAVDGTTDLQNGDELASEGAIGMKSVAQQMADKILEGFGNVTVDTSASEGFSSFMNDLTAAVTNGVLGGGLNEDGSLPETTSNMYSEVGGNIVKAICEGITGALQSAYDSGKAIAGAACDGVKAYGYTAYYNIGYYNIQGLIDGANSQANALYIAYGNLGSLSATAYKQRVGQASPSKVFKRMGVYDVMGLINGAKSMSGELESAYGGIGSDSVYAAVSAISRAMNSSSMDDYAPSIIPVVDTSQIQNGMNSIDQMFGSRAMMYGAQVTADIASNVDRAFPAFAEAQKYNDSNVIQAITDLNDRIDTLGSKMSRMQIRLDGNELVGGVQYKMNNALGSMQTKINRGVM